MKILAKILLFNILLINHFSCISSQKASFQAKEIYKSDSLIVVQITENTFQHISFLQTNDFGNVPCNGLIVRDNNEAIIFDTPASPKASEALIRWIRETLQCKINAIIPTHFHNDCLAGLQVFDENHIPSYAYSKTIELAKENHSILPKNSFTDALRLDVGSKHVIVKFFGEGHTKDNVVGYFPSENVMFGGCLIKELNASKGYLGDANTTEWSHTVQKIKQKYTRVKVIVPGHGKFGNQQLLDYTIQLFKKP